MDAGLSAVHAVLARGLGYRKRAHQPYCVKSHVSHSLNIVVQGPIARGPFPAQTRQSVAYEVRIYSISGSSFGEVVWAKRIRAAHCLTSLQFSPTSEHILLAYGR